MTSVTLYLIRHGKTSGNILHQYLGSTDEPLCVDGIDEINGYINRGIYPKVDNVFISPMTRCFETAALIFKNRNFTVIQGLKELDFGPFEGKTYNELRYTKDYQNWLASSGEEGPEGVEPKACFINRVTSSFAEMIDKYDLSSPIAIVAHSGTFMALLSEYAGLNYYDGSIESGNGFVCTLEYDTNSDGLVMNESIKIYVNGKLLGEE